MRIPPSAKGPAARRKIMMSVFSSQVARDGGNSLRKRRSKPTGSGFLRSLVDFTDSFRPGASHVLMSSISHAKKMEYLRSGVAGSDKWLFHYTKRMGVNAIGACMQQLAQMADISDWKAKTNHTLRQHSITRLVNNPAVNRVEVAKVARHKSTGTQDAYTRPTEQSEMACNMALRRIHKPDAVSVSASMSSGPGLRQQSVTRLVNNPAISRDEIAKLARHKSTGTEDAYTDDASSGQPPSITGADSVATFSNSPPSSNGRGLI